MIACNEGLRTSLVPLLGSRISEETNDSEADRIADVTEGNSHDGHCYNRCDIDSGACEHDAPYAETTPFARRNAATPKALLTLLSRASALDLTSSTFARRRLEKSSIYLFRKWPAAMVAAGSVASARPSDNSDNSANSSISAVTSPPTRRLKAIPLRFGSALNGWCRHARTASSPSTYPRLAARRITPLFSPRYWRRWQAVT